MRTRHGRAVHVTPLLKLFVSVTLLAVACKVVDEAGPNSDITQLAVDPDSAAAAAGQTIQFQAIGSTADGAKRIVPVQWSTTGGMIDTNGLYTADSSAGNFDVTATLDNSTLHAKARVRNHGVMKRVALVPDTVSLAAGGTAQFSAFAVTASGDSFPVDASYSATGGSITASGMYTAGGSNGVFVVVATVPMAHGGGTISDTAQVTITGGTPAPVTSVTISPATASVAVGATVQLSATLEDANGNVLTGRTTTWSSSDSGTAAVSGSGLVTGVAAGGPVTITATSEGQSGTAAITVTATPAPVATVTVSPATASVAVGATVQLTATLKDAGGNVLTGRTIAWSSSATGTASVNGSGLVTGVAAGGPVTITATSEGQSGTAAITVTPAPVATVTVSPATASVAVGATVQLTATLKDAGGNVLTGRTITWSSSATGTASVNGSGLVTGVAAGGPVTITATSEGQSGTAAVLVTQPSSTLPLFGHVAIVVEENTSFSEVTSSSMPFLFSWMTQFALATQYYANTHPSIGNYFELTAGDTITNNDSFSQTVTADNIVRHLLAAGKTWKSYAEDLPSVGYTGPSTGNYARKHNPLSFFSDVVNDPVQVKRLVPFTQFALDLAGDTLPNYSFIVPNLCDDAHDCSLQTADNWLKANVAPLLANPSFQRDGLLIVVFDESSGDNTNGGGRVVWTAISPKANLGFTSTTLYQHQNTLRLMAEGLGLTSFPGEAATASNMAEFFHP